MQLQNILKVGTSYSPANRLCKKKNAVLTWTHNPGLKLGKDNITGTLSSNIYYIAYLHELLAKIGKKLIDLEIENLTCNKTGHCPVSSRIPARDGFHPGKLRFVLGTAGFLLFYLSSLFAFGT
jgi:hypothetical protein